MATNPYIDLVIKATKALPKAGTALAKKASKLQPLPQAPARSFPVDIVPKEMERTGMGTTVLNKFSPQVDINRGAVGADPVGDLASRGYSMWRDAMQKNLESNPTYGMTGVTNEKGDAIRNLLIKYVQDEARRTGTSAQRLYDRSRDEGEVSGILKEGPTLAKNILWDAPIGAVGATFMGGTELAQGTPMGKPINKIMEALTFLPEKVREGTLGIGKTPLIPQVTIDAEGKPHFKAGGPSLENIIGTSNLTSASELLRDLAYGAEFGGIAKGARGVGKRVGDADYREAFTKTALPELAPLFYGGAKGPSTSFAGTIPGGKQVSQFVEGLVKGEGAFNKVDPLLQEAKKYKSAEEFVKSIPETVSVWNKSKFSDKGAFIEVPVIRKESGITLYQGGKGEGRQFWTTNKKYAEQFGEVEKKTGDFYQVNNGNRVTDVYVEAPSKSQLTDIYNQAHKGAKIDPLMVEAKKYKSVEEFVKAQGNEIFHASERPRVVGQEPLFFSTKNLSSIHGEHVLSGISPKNILEIPYHTVGEVRNNSGKWINEGYDAISWGKDSDVNGKTIVILNPEKSLRTKQQLTDIYNQAHKGAKIDPLMVEAKKYKSVEEFVKKQPVIYHGTDNNFSKFDLNKMEGGVAYFTDNLKDFDAGNTSGAVGTKIKMERYLSPKLKLGGYDEADKFSTGELINQGYHGLKLEKDGATWYEIFNPNQDLLTKSQLTDIYNQAHSKANNTSSTMYGGVPGVQGISKVVEGLVAGEKALNKVDPLLQEAKKYKSSEEFVSNTPVLEKKIGKDGTQIGGKIYLKDGEIKYSVEDGIMIIDDIDVKTQKQGTGTKLMSEVENVADSLGVDKIELGAFPQNKSITSDALKDFYENLGYEVVDSYPFEGQMYYEMVKTPGGAGKLPLEKSQLTDIWNQAHGKANNTSSTMYGGVPGMQGVSRVVGGLIEGEKTLRDKVQNISTEVPTRAIPKNQKELLEEANGMGVSLDEMKDHLKGQYDELLNDEIKYLQESSKQGVQQGGIVRDTEGGVVNRFGRQSNNPQWYRDFFAEKGRAPNKNELAQIAIKNLIKGSGEVPKNDFFIELKNKLENIDGIKNTTVFQPKNANTPEVQYAGNIKMKNIGSSDDARALINLNAERFKKEGILPAGDRVSLEQMRKEANDLAESTGLSRGVIEQWAKESEGNRSKITATRQELSDRASTATSLIQKLQLDPTNAELKTQVSGALKELQFLQVATNKMIAESARTLGANRIKTLETDAQKIEQYIKDNLSKDPNALAEHLSTVPLKDLPKTLKQIASPGFIDRVMSVRQASLLTDPRTWERNILGNTAGAALRKIQKPLDILSDQIIKKVKGEPSARSWTEMNTGKYKKLLSSDTVKQWLEEYASSTNKYEGAESKRWLVEKGAQKVFDFLEFQDLFFKKAIAKDVIASSAKRTAKFEGLKGKEFDARVKELLKNPTDSMFEEMSKVALEWTYQTQPKGRLYKTAKSIRDIPVVGKLAVPFLKTVWNIGRMGLERTVYGQPLNLVRLATGKHSAEQALSNLLLATALQSTISAGVEAGVITGTERDTKKRMLNEAEGIKDDLIKTPLGSFSYKNLEPVSTIIGSGVDLHNAMKGVLRGEQSVLEGVGQTSFSVADRFVNNSFLRGVSDLLDLIPQYNKMSGRGAEEKQVNDWSEYGSKQIASFYPRAFNWLEEIVGGQKVQRPEGEGMAMDKFLSGITNHLTASTPGISGDIPVKIDIWGEEVRKQQVTKNPVINNILNALVPVQLEKRKEDPVNAELLKLKYYPQAPAQTLDGYRMTNKEYEQYMKVVGKETKQKLDTLIGEEKYKNAQESDKVDMIKKVMSAVKKEHKDMFFDKVNESKLKQLKEAQASGDTVTAQNLIETMQKGVQKLPPRERETADSKRAKIKAEIKRKNMSESQRQMFSTLASEVQSMEYNEAKAHVLKKYPNINRVNLENFLVWAYSGAEF